MLEGGDLHGRRREIHLPAYTCDLRLMVFDVGLLPSSQRLFLGDQVDNHGSLPVGRLRLRLERCYMLRQRNDLIAQPFGFNVMGLQHDQLLKIRMHLASLFPSRPLPNRSTAAENSESSTGGGASTLSMRPTSCSRRCSKDPSPHRTGPSSAASSWSATLSWDESSPSAPSSLRAPAWRTTPHRQPIGT